LHDIRAGKDEVDFRLTLKNAGTSLCDVQCFSRACAWTDLRRNNPITLPKSFIFTERGLTMLDKTSRTEEAVYRGGQFTCPEE